MTLLKQQTDRACGLSVLRLHKGPFYWGEFYENTIKIWPKGIVNDFSASYIYGEIGGCNVASVINGRIVNRTIITIPPWLAALAVFSFFPGSGYLIYSFFTFGEWIIEIFISILLSFFILSSFIFQKVSEFQEEDLEKFLKTAFGKHLDSCSIY